MEHITSRKKFNEVVLKATLAAQKNTALKKQEPI
jgi:hypothetical protein